MEIISIIPRPLKMTVAAGTFSLTPEAEILVSEENVEVGIYLAQRLRPATGFHLPVKQIEYPSQWENGIVLQTSPEKNDLGTEGYELSVRSDRVIAAAPTPVGIFYACQTLLQLLPAAIESKATVSGQAWSIRQMEIEDQPQFP
jgi:hexosaminidase